MKNVLRGIAASIAAAALLTAGMSSASAAIAATATPTTGVKAGDTISLSVTGLTGSVGVYASLCKGAASAMAAPTDCDPDQTHMVWITGTGAQGSNKDSGKITAVASFTAASGTKVDCLVDACVIYVRGDHNNSSDYSLIRTIALTFAAGGGVVKKTDVPTATFNGVAAQPNVPGNLTYRVPATLVVTAASGLPVTLKSLTPDCAVDGTKITALKGAGVCAIAAVTTGNDTYAAFSAAVNFPFYLHQGAQVVTSTLALKKIVWGAPVTVKASAFASDMGEDIVLTSSTPGACVVIPKDGGWTVAGVNTGTCSLVATGPADATKYNAGSVTVSVPVAWK